MLWIVLINYICWYVFIYISVVMLLTLLQNSSRFSSFKKAKKLPFVSILIPAYNEEKVIAKCIRSVLNLDYPKKLLEIIVINDGSKDNTSKIVNRFVNKNKIVKLLNNKVNRGKSYSLNKGIKVAKGDVIACMDADSIVERSALKKMVACFNDPKVAAVTPALKVYRPKHFLEKLQFVEYLLNIFLRKILAWLDSIHVTPGAFSLYRKSVLKKIGCFEEGNLTEDLEIALRMHNAGYKIENVTSAVSYTICPNRWKTLLRQRIRWYRGVIQNSIKYRHMFFNSKYGNLGIFLLPANIISVIAVIGIFSAITWDFLSSIIRTLWHLSLIDWDLSIFFENFDLFYVLFQFISIQMVLGITGLIIGTYILYKSFKLANEHFGLNRVNSICYLLFYPYILMGFWSIALICEIIRIKRKW